jgi:FtsJ-like methyltransferase
MTDESMMIRVLPDNSIAVMVHKQFVDRVKDFLLLPLDYPIPWKVLQVHVKRGHFHNGEVTSCNDQATAEENLSPNSSFNATLLDTTETSGMSHDRRGFQVWCCQNTTRPIYAISPLARQNMAWAVKLTHCCTVARSFASMEDIASQIVETLPLNDVPMILLVPGDQPHGDQKLLRVDVYPKQYTESICLGLQRACHKRLPEQSTSTSTSTSTPKPIPSHPFGGPIAMTRSASKCSHRLAIILSTRDTVNGGSNKEAVETTQTLHIYWGWMDRCNPADEAMMAIKVNEFANHEILLVAPDHVTGKEVGDGAVIVPVHTPLSRAYYKLDQVWDDILELHENDTLDKIAGSTAVDFGSAPGGWTQVLAFRGTGFPTICSVDKGMLAERIAKLSKVRYIPSLAEDCEADIAPFEPFGLVVCDASLLWSEALDLFQDIVAQRAPNVIGQETRPNKFTLPCIFIITMKLPFQTLPSIQRHIDLINQRLPHYLSRMAAAMCTNGEPIVQARHTLVHLMANSTAERTLVAIFEEQPSEE